MPLFDDIARTHTRPRLNNESTFAYYNNSARVGIRAIRDLLEDWFGRYPVAHQVDLRARFRSTIDSQHQGAFLELYWHELLLKLGYEVDVHPTTEVGTAPDFAARRQGEVAFYLEATIALPVSIDANAERRLLDLYDSLNQINSPNFFLEIEQRGEAATPIPARRLRNDLEQWLAGLDPDAISTQIRTEGFAELPTLEFAHDGVTLTFSPIPKGPDTRGRHGLRPIGMTMPWDLRTLKTHEDIKRAVESKAKKYGNLGLPLVVAVNVMDDFFDTSDLANGLLGEETIVIAAGRRAEQGPRRRNGAFYGARGARNIYVSAVAVTHQLAPPTIASLSPLLMHHPEAINPLDQNVWPFHQWIPNAAAGAFNLREGRAARDVLAVPATWPIYD